MAGSAFRFGYLTVDTSDVRLWQLFYYDPGAMPKNNGPNIQRMRTINADADQAAEMNKANARFKDNFIQAKSEVKHQMSYRIAHQNPGKEAPRFSHGVLDMSFNNSSYKGYLSSSSSFSSLSSISVSPLEMRDRGSSAPLRLPGVRIIGGVSCPFPGLFF